MTITLTKEQWRNAYRFAADDLQGRIAVSVQKGVLSIHLSRQEIEHIGNRCGDELREELAAQMVREDSMTW